jgi:uncharacterized protein (TIGR02284 family)
MKEQIVDQVNKIIQTNLDRKEGYEKALEQIKDSGLKTLFEDCRNQSSQYVEELRQIVLNNGGEPASDTSTAGDLYRAWMDIKSALSMDNIKAVLQSCERGEDVALNAYRQVTETDANDAIADGDVLSSLNRQKDGILSMHNRVKALRDMQ